MQDATVGEAVASFGQSTCSGLLLDRSASFLFFELLLLNSYSDLRMPSLLKHLGLGTPGVQQGL